MTSLSVLDNEDLLQRLAVYNNSPSDVEDIKAEIIRRMVKKSQVRQVDLKLIDQIIKKAKAIENADFDLMSQSQRLKDLSGQYHRLKKQLLLRMEKESGVLCEATS